MVVVARAVLTMTRLPKVSGLLLRVEFVAHSHSLKIFQQLAKFLAQLGIRALPTTAQQP
jgi:hypothetical protein